MKCWDKGKTYLDLVQLKLRFSPKFLQSCDKQGFVKMTKVIFLADLRLILSQLGYFFCFMGLRR
jgi:hypothetical protein